MTKEQERSQISTTVAAETRRRADILVEALGYTYREIVTLGIESLWNQYRREHMVTAHDRAIARVNATPELEPYRDLFIEYDWPNQDEHYGWVATAPVAELIDWAKQIREDEGEGESQEGDEQNA
ncbi:MAG: hypothetical protein GX657_15550 [Chloroflexi bacterium]|nr:hypothetical protein [Chloroflexota bacterium]